VNDSVHNVLVMSGFTSILKTFPSVTEAALGFSAD
jgi:hypothetical protein